MVINIVKIDSRTLRKELGQKNQSRNKKFKKYTIQNLITSKQNSIICTASFSELPCMI